MSGSVFDKIHIDRLGLLLYERLQDFVISRSKQNGFKLLKNILGLNARNQARVVSNQSDQGLHCELLTRSVR